MNVFNNLMVDKIKKALSFLLLEIVAIIAVIGISFYFGTPSMDAILIIILVVSVMAVGFFVLTSFIQSEKKWTLNKYQLIPIANEKFLWLNQLTTLLQVVFFSLLQLVLNFEGIRRLLGEYGAYLTDSAPLQQAAGSGFDTMQKYFHAFQISGNTFTINWFALIGGISLMLLAGFFLNYSTWTMVDLLALTMEKLVSFKGSRIIFFAVFYIAFNTILVQVANFLNYAAPQSSDATLNYGAYITSGLFIIIGALVNWLNSWLYNKFVSTTK